MRKFIQAFVVTLAGTSLVSVPARASIDFAATEITQEAPPPKPSAVQAKQKKSRFLDAKCNLVFDASPLSPTFYLSRQPVTIMQRVVHNLLREELDMRPECAENNKRKITIFMGKRKSDIGFYKMTDGEFSGKFYTRKLKHFLGF
jgi:hypothetical protein